MSDDVRICVVGDSLVAGVGDPTALGWVGRLAARGAAHGRPATVYNLGVRRHTSADVERRWRAECGERLPAGCDARVVFSFGVNDAMREAGSLRVPTAQTAANLAGMLEGAAIAGWRALVVGPVPVADPAHTEACADVERRLGAACSAHGVPFVPVLEPLQASEAWMEQVRLGDGAHPGAEGYDTLAELIWPHWWSWLAG